MALEAEMLERLVIDRDLGELSEDAAALLDSYLSGEPRLSVDHAALATTIEMTRRALRGPEGHDATPLPPPRFLSHRATSPRRDRIVGGLAGFSLAAAIAIAVLLGRQGPATNKFTGQSALVATATRGDEAGGFWATRNFLTKPNLPRDSARKVIWHTPVTKPEMGV